MIDIVVAPAIYDDLKFIDHLQRKNAEELAFYPNQVFEREIQNFRILLARVNGEPAGYLYHGAFNPVTKIHQACIEYDLRGQLYGSELVRAFSDIAKAHKVFSITLRCGSDIEANFFWGKMGFVCEAVVPGGIRRMRDINCWRLPLQRELFEPLTVNPSTKKQDSSIWAKRKSGAGVSKFSRGRELKIYREKLIRSAGND